MVICPLNTGECNRLVVPRPKTVFVMAPSIKYQTDASEMVLRKIIEGLSDRSLKIIEGSGIARHGDYFCSICQETQGCAFGVAMVHDGLPVSTIGNIYLETGIMQGFGKPVILIADKKRNLPSDYVRHYAVFYSSRDYLARYGSLLDDIAKLPEDLYEHVGQFAFKAGDYEKAAKYYQEGYLINPKQETLAIIQSIATSLDKSKGVPIAYKQRLLDNIRFFVEKVQKPG